MDYSHLKPGYYVSVGGNTKALVNMADLLAGSAGIVPDVEKAAELVSWVFVALDRRREQLLEIPYQWRRGEDDAGEPPFTFRLRRDLPRIDESLQLYSVAYLHKERVGRRVRRLRFLDPTTMEPDEQSKDSSIEGYRQYFRTLDGAYRQAVPVEDLIIIKRWGLRELDPATPASMATKLAAEILYGMRLATSTFYKSNAIPPFLIYVPPTTGKPERDRLEHKLARLLNPKLWGSVEYRTTAVSADVKVTPLGLAPKDLDAGAQEDSLITSVLAAHGVPRSIVYEDANYATAQDKRRAFVGTMGGRFEQIAEEINLDPDIAALGVALDPLADQHWAMRRDEAEVSLAFNRYLAGMPPQAAAYTVGIRLEDYPDDIGPVFLEQALMAQSPSGRPSRTSDAGGPAEPEAEEMATVEAKSGAWQLDAQAFRRWYKKRDGADVGGFKSNHLSRADKLAIADEIGGGAAEDAPFRWQSYP